MKGYEGFCQGIPEMAAGDFALKEELRKTVRIFPHKMKGEGHFLALLKKRADRNSEENCRFCLESARKIRQVTVDRGTDGISLFTNPKFRFGKDQDSWKLCILHAGAPSRSEGNPVPEDRPSSWRTEEETI